MRHVSGGRSGTRRRLSESKLTAAIAYGAVCPVLSDEISAWARKLGGGGAERERRLQNLVTYGFDQASSLSRVSQEPDAARVRPYVKHRLDLGDSPDTIA